MKLEDIMNEWSKDCKIDETELAVESTKIPELHEKYLRMFVEERHRYFKMKYDLKKHRRILFEYYLGELDKEELEELGREPFYKKLLKNEVDLYIDSDDSMTEVSLKLAAQEEKVNYLETVLKSINNRGFQIKNALEWIRLTS